MHVHTQITVHVQNISKSHILKQSMLMYLLYPVMFKLFKAKGVSQIMSNQLSELQKCPPQKGHLLRPLRKNNSSDLQHLRWIPKAEVSNSLRGTSMQIVL